MEIKKIKTQKAFSFDKVTKRKILKSFLISAVSATTTGIGAFKETGNFRASGIITLLTFSGFIMNAIIKYVQGEPEPEKK